MLFPTLPADDDGGMNLFFTDLMRLLQESDAVAPVLPVLDKDGGAHLIQFSLLDTDDLGDGAVIAMVGAKGGEGGMKAVEDAINNTPGTASDGPDTSHTDLCTCQEQQEAALTVNRFLHRFMSQWGALPPESDRQPYSSTKRLSRVPEGYFRALPGEVLEVYRAKNPLDLFAQTIESVYHNQTAVHKIPSEIPPR